MPANAVEINESKTQNAKQTQSLNVGQCQRSTYKVLIPHKFEHFAVFWTSQRIPSSSKAPPLAPVLVPSSRIQIIYTAGDHL